MVFTETDCWSGGDFELSLELGPPNDERLRIALSTLWAHSTLEGCYLDRSIEPAHQSRVEAVSQPFMERALLGVAMTPVGRRVACQTYVIRDETTDWLGLAIPLSSLRKSYDVGSYPFQEGVQHEWIVPMSEWFRSIGETVFRAVAFQLGVVAWEVDLQLTAVSVRESGIPKDRWDGYLWPTGETLEWYPPTVLDAPLELD